MLSAGSVLQELGIHVCLDVSLVAPARVHICASEILRKCPVVVGTIVSIKRDFSNNTHYHQYFRCMNPLFRYYDRVIELP